MEHLHHRHRLVVFFLNLVVLGVNTQETCGDIGNSNEIRIAERRDQMFYLDVANPAPCDGRIMNWRVCYYGPTSSSFFNFNARSYWATYAVYRRMGDGATLRYERVSETFTAVRANRFFLRIAGGRQSRVDGEIRSGFRCYNDPVGFGSVPPLTVQAGDVVGTCVFNPIDQGRLSRSQLNVVGVINTAESLLGTNTVGCTVYNIPFSIAANQLSVVNSRRLHIHARVGRLI